MIIQSHITYLSTSRVCGNENVMVILLLSIIRLYHLKCVTRTLEKGLYMNICNFCIRRHYNDINARTSKADKPPEIVQKKDKPPERAYEADSIVKPRAQKLVAHRPGRKLLPFISGTPRRCLIVSSHTSS